MHGAAFKRVLAVAATAIALMGLGVPAAHAGGYPVKCDKQTVLVVEYAKLGTGEDFTTTTFTGPTAIQDAVIFANGDPTGSSVGNTVIVCPGTYYERVVVPLADAGGDNTNLTIRSWSGPDDTSIIGDLSDENSVIDIQANGVSLGGAGLGFTILGSGAPASGEKAGIQIGAPADPDLEERDDQELAECADDPISEDPPPPTGFCDDEEKPAATPINVSVTGNEIGDLVPPTFAGTVSGIAVNNSNNTVVFRNLIKRLAVGGDSLAYGIRFSDTNANVDILQNAVKELTQTGGTCASSTLAVPTVGAIGIAAEEEALDALLFNNLVEKVEATCTAIGAYSNAWGGLENDRNGQQIPIVTDVRNNKIKEVEGAASAAVVLGPLAQTNEDGEEVAPPSSFRVGTNDFDNTGIGVAVYNQLAPYTYIEDNNFDNNEIGVLNDGNDNLDATNNWWGCAEGPYSGKCATEVTIAGSTHVSPWLRNHVDHAGAHAGDHAGHH